MDLAFGGVGLLVDRDSGLLSSHPSFFRPSPRWLHLHDWTHFESLIMIMILFSVLRLLPVGRTVPKKMHQDCTFLEAIGPTSTSSGRSGGTYETGRVRPHLPPRAYSRLYNFVQLCSEPQVIAPPAGCCLLQFKGLASRECNPKVSHPASTVASALAETLLMEGKKRALGFLRGFLSTPRGHPFLRWDPELSVSRWRWVPRV